MSEVKIKKKSGAFPAASQADGDALYFKTDTNNVQLKLGSMPLKHDVVSLSFSHGQSSSSTDCILEATSDYITTVYDGLKIIVSDITDASTAGYRYGSSTNIIRINTQDDYMIYNANGSGRLTKEDIEPGGAERAVLLQFVSSLDSGSGGWIIVGQYGVLPTAGGTMSGNIAMGGNKITGVAPGSSDNDVVVCKQTLLKDESDDFNANACKITHLDEPSDNSDAATKYYVDTTVATSIAAAIQGIDLNPSVCFTTIRAIDGSKNMNVAVMHYTTGHEPALLFDAPMKPNTVCHIITYRTGDTDYPSSSAGAFDIPKDICVGGQDSDTNFLSSRNYVWINGTLVNGGSVDGSSDTVSFETSALGTREIDIFYSKQEVAGQENTYWYQTFIKVDQD